MGLPYTIQTGALTAIILTIAQVINAGEYCFDSNNYVYCSGYCCESGSTECCTDNWGWIAGAVIGGIIFVAIIGTIIFLVCSKMNSKKVRTVNVQNNSRVVSHGQTHSQGRNMYSMNMYGNQHNLQPAPYHLPPPPAYTTVADPNSAYLPPPPYPGTPLPPQYSEITSPRNNYTTLGNTTSDPAYPPPPVS